MFKSSSILILIAVMTIRGYSQTVTIGTQVWMTKNLDVSAFRNGDPIPYAKTEKEWKRANLDKQPAWCYFENNSENGNYYGKLYNWYAVNDPRGLAPKGWHIPTNYEWTTLVNFLGDKNVNFSGDKNVAVRKMKADGYWPEVDWIDGKRNSAGEFSDVIDYRIDWWSSNESDDDMGFVFSLYYYSDTVDVVSLDGELKAAGYPVRCLKDTDEVTIGTQVWMTKNLDVSTFRNGDPIPQAKTEEEWKRAGKKQQPAWCYFRNDPANGEKYGKLYNWYAVNDPRGLAPKGWHIPTDYEWTILSNYLGGYEAAGTKLKSTSGWADDLLLGNGVDIPRNGNGTNESGFNGLPGGARDYKGLFFGDGRNSESFWWSSTESSTDDDDVLGRRMFTGSPSGYGLLRAVIWKEWGYSVRCLRD